MSEKLNFKEYLASKNCLRESIKEPPKTTLGYEVKKYCNFPVSENQKIKLRPKNKMYINWLVEDKENPQAIGVTFEGTDIDGEHETPVWNDKKILKWLLNNTEHTEE